MRTSGIIPIGKPKGWTSFDVVNKLKHMLKPQKVGHLGTLDPMATGVLLVTVGKATRLFDILQAKPKTYQAKFAFGYETDTLDSTGKTVANTTNIPTLGQIVTAIPSQIGAIQQIPPKFSAKSVNGKRAYDLARAGLDFELRPKQVKIDYIKVLDYKDGELSVEVSCGSGTYIRAIGRDLARKVGSLATMTELIRTQVGKITLDDCVEIEDINPNNISKHCLPIDALLDMPVFELDENLAQKLLCGQQFSTKTGEGRYLAKLNGEVFAIIDITDGKANMAIYLQENAKNAT